MVSFFVVGGIRHSLLGLSAWHPNPFYVQGISMFMSRDEGQKLKLTVAAIVDTDFPSLPCSQGQARGPGMHLWQIQIQEPGSSLSCGSCGDSTRKNHFCRRSGNNANLSKRDSVAAAATTVSLPDQCCNVTITGKPWALFSSFPVVLTASDPFKTLIFGLIGQSQLWNTSLCWTSLC